MNDSHDEHRPARTAEEEWRAAIEQLQQQKTHYACELLSLEVAPPPEAMQALASFLELAQPAVEAMQAVLEGRAKFKRYERPRQPLTVDTVRKARRKQAASYKPPPPSVPADVMFLFDWVLDTGREAGTRDYRMRALERAAQMMESRHGISIDADALDRRIRRQQKNKGHTNRR